MPNGRATMMDGTARERTIANPAPLGLMALGVTTILLNMHNIGSFPLDSMVLSMGFFYGGLVSVIAGLMEWKNGNTFGMVSLISFGMFWLSLVGLITIPAIGIGQAPGPSSLASYFLIWSVFTFIMLLGTLRTNKVIIFVFSSLALLLFLTGLGYALGSSTITTIAGAEGIVVGISIMYAAAAELLNGIYDRTVLPLFPVRKVVEENGEIMSKRQYS